MSAVPWTTSRCPETLSFEPMLKSPSRAVPLGTVTRMAPSCGRSAVRSWVSMAVGLLRSSSETGACPAPPCGIARGAGRGACASCVGPVTSDTSDQKPCTSWTAREPAGVTLGAAKATRGTIRMASASSAMDRLDAHMRHPRRREREEPAKGQDSAQIGQEREPARDGEACGARSQFPESGEPGLLDEVRGHPTHAEPGGLSRLRREPAAQRGERLLMPEGPDDAAGHRAEHHDQQ